MRIYVYILKILLSIVLAVVGGFFAYEYVIDSLYEVKELSIIVVSVFMAGLIFSLIRIKMISSKFNWVDSYRKQTKVSAASAGKVPSVFRNVYKKCNMNDKDKLQIEEYYNAVKSLDVSFSSHKDAGMFFVKICFLTGFLGAFVCIITSLGDISEMFSNMNLNVGDSVSTLSELQSGIAGPLAKLKTAFSLSFTGIYLSCLLSYIDRQAFSLENKFLVYAENWLLSCVNLKSK